MVQVHSGVFLTIMSDLNEFLNLPSENPEIHDPKINFDLEDLGTMYLDLDAILEKVTKNVIEISTSKEKSDDSESESFANANELYYKFINNYWKRITVDLHLLSLIQKDLVKISKVDVNGEPSFSTIN